MVLTTNVAGLGGGMCLATARPSRNRLDAVCDATKRAEQIGMKGGELAEKIYKRSTNDDNPTIENVLERLSLYK